MLIFSVFHRLFGHVKQGKIQQYWNSISFDPDNYRELTYVARHKNSPMKRSGSFQFMTMSESGTSPAQREIYDAVSILYPIKRHSVQKLEISIAIVFISLVALLRRGRNDAWCLY